MVGDSCAIRGAFFDLVDDPWKHVGREQDAARFVRDGLLVVKGGVIADFGDFADVARRHPNLAVTHLPNRLILPGFIDWSAGQAAMRWRQSLVTKTTPETVEQAARLLFGVMTLGDVRNIDESWVAGKRAYKKGAA